MGPPHQQQPHSQIIPPVSQDVEISLHQKRKLKILQ
jgi:hypothetical protein